jgi:hypothetical protein
MVDPAVNTVLLSYYSCAVPVVVGNSIGGKRLVEVVVLLGTTTSDVSSFTATEALSIRRVLH